VQKHKMASDLMAGIVMHNRFDIPLYKDTKTFSLSY
jgi:hypothetical protein